MEIPGIHQGVPDLGTAETKKPWKLGQSLRRTALCQGKCQCFGQLFGSWISRTSQHWKLFGGNLQCQTLMRLIPEVHICCLEEVFGGVALCGLHVTPCIKAEPQTHAFHEFQEHAKTRQFSRSGRLCELPCLRASTFLFPRAVE